MTLTRPFTTNAAPQQGPREVPHTMANLGGETVRALGVVTPAVAEICARYGVRALGPPLSGDGR